MHKFDSIVHDLKNCKQPSESYDICNCYTEVEEKHYFTEFELGMSFAEGLPNKKFENRKVSHCAGTKECETCSCGGNRAKCDFYDYVRDEAKAQQKKENKLRSALENITMVVDLGFDYDGFEKSEDLKELIDELVEYARKAKKDLREYLKEEKKNG